jgi:hypothetical protein
LTESSTPVLRFAIHEAFESSLSVLKRLVFREIAVHPPFNERWVGSTADFPSIGVRRWAAANLYVKTVKFSGHSANMR